MRAKLLTTATILLGLAAPAAATAQTQAVPTAAPLAPLTSDAPLAAYGGWVVTSERDPAGQWHLVTFHDGVKETPGQVPSRAVPFDVDVGPGPHGRIEAVYSRCAKERAEGTPQPWFSARGCLLEETTLPGGRQVEIPMPRPRGAVDGTPSLWGDQLAFQRRSAGRRDVAQVELYDMKTRRLSTLPHGTVPHHCPYASCPTSVFRGEVSELDLGARTLAYAWTVQAPSIEGVGAGTELRAVSLRDHQQFLAGTGYVSGACGGRGAVSPNAVGAGVEFLSVETDCDVSHGVITTATFTRAGRLTAPQPADPTNTTALLRLARDAATGTTYGLLGPARSDGATALPAATLELVRLDGVTPATREGEARPMTFQ